MIIWGARGLAKELLNGLNEDGLDENIVFFDNLSESYDLFLAKNYQIITNFDSLRACGQNKIILGVGGASRYKLASLIKENGFEEVGYISKEARVGKLDNHLDPTVTILQGARVTMSVTIGKSCLINKDVIISHDASVGDYSEVSPGAKVLGGVQIGSFCNIGANATILPRVKIGDNCKIGAGAVITKDVPENSVVVGVPGKVIGK
ncbi:acetyltransferase [Vibrio sp. WXL210]|uniref:acetyltransferase n=1 Tax=Vibrio sp. WXL210 TaxID=3450709 RepID=UPI003EC77FC1